MIEILLSSLLLSNLHQKDSSFTVKGYLPGEQQAKTLYLRYNEHLDSAVVTKGHFEFKGFVSQPVPANLYSNNGNVTFYLEAGEVMVTSAGSLQGAVVRAGQTELEQQVLNKQQEPYTKLRDELQTRKYLNRDNEDSVIALAKEMTKLEKDISAIQVQFVKSFPDSYVSYEVMKNYSYAIDPNTLGPMLDALNPSFKTSADAKDIMRRLEIAKRTWIGKPALEFTQNDVNGKPVSLKSFRGKYVMIDFWASWCGWCRIEHPNYIKAYERYKDKGFTFLSVSLDDAKDKDKWIAAIKKDGLPWTQVCDLKGRENEVAMMYGIKGIPQNVLVGPDGTIVAKNLRGDDLLVKLQELLGK